MLCYVSKWLDRAVFQLVGCLSAFLPVCPSAHLDAVLHLWLQPELGMLRQVTDYAQGEPVVEHYLSNAWFL